MNRTQALTLSFILTALVLLTTTAALADTFLVTVNTTPLSGTTQYFAFGLTNSNSASNTVVLSGFSFGAGSAVAGIDDCTLGGSFSGLGCSGNLASQVTLQDLDVAVFFRQQYTAGTSLSFYLNTTNNFNSGGGFPDQLSMFLCDASFSNCYSDDSITGAMLLLDLDGGPTQVSDFVLNGAARQNLNAPVVTQVPEPASMLLLATGLAGTRLAKRRKKAA